MKPTNEFTDMLKCKAGSLFYCCSIAMYLNELKSVGVVTVLCDFTENYKMRHQEFHWNNAHATLPSLVIYFQESPVDGLSNTSLICSNFFLSYT
jgi:hypothetical protein